MSIDEPSSEAPDALRAKRQSVRWRIVKWSFRGVLLAAVGAIAGMAWMISGMPGKSYKGALPSLTAAQQELRDELRRDVGKLADDIGERNVYTRGSLDEAVDWIESEFKHAGYAVERQTFEVMRTPCHNLIVELAGKKRADEILVVGAHYDTVPDCPGANDNGSAVAALLALARRLAQEPHARTLRFVAFANEEPPFFWTDEMGSLIYARRCRERDENIIGMIALETMGYYSDERGSQAYPPPFSLLYPSTGDFIAFVGNMKSRPFIRTVVGAFRRHAQFPSQGAAIPGIVPQAGWSDHWSFWQAGYPGLMVTDTAPFRYPHYHMPEDTSDKIDYDRLARVVAGMEDVIRELVND